MRRAFILTRSCAVPAPVDEVAAVLTDLEHYPEWWPQVVAVAKIDDDNARVLCRSSLPYLLDLVLTAVSRVPPVVEVALAGDLAGFARFSLASTPDGTRLDFHQEVSVSGLLALAAYVGRPVLLWNHERMMAGCEAGLRARLAERVS
ncbi:SRPBCC family protein [Nocardioides sp. Kera G14]|uniref:SRPBCC family protein n=1 Tax=Nocardioides sp. Kera G14 TaxID=2884264 RepID=UPI001D1132D3|nr:SRPBCC family protein [Nocardioides sp. Kera G14]UDY22868.1 SRPBCC family protein [Nocardioides sp. Kera G14]